MAFLNFFAQRCDVKCQLYSIHVSTSSSKSDSKFEYIDWRGKCMTSRATILKIVYAEFSIGYENYVTFAVVV
ncbi:uncharacterized protein PHALS_14697 [Plasmopara halstedii]|uniref:Uncharacterized protein n=1 Tax=Plasmopara halstedii TaxID=4781 RepID=A0A0P1APZ6_PLAHL|nr:uncharacterized protein PHALS_14697 [Plasmopara halstedii]CEG43274.1 hypothetical protein PHALS_14697 [Plasmopara halstedii]|eukprot:XP_024579643.1 hypothetical protein PHALS_14697 [Plasmopara halstedii]